MKSLMVRFKNEEGQGMVEYGLLIGLISIVAIVAIASFGTNILEMYNKYSDKVSEAMKP